MANYTLAHIMTISLLAYHNETSGDFQRTILLTVRESETKTCDEKATHAAH